MDRWGDLSTSWPLSQEVVSWAAEKSDYLLLTSSSSFLYPPPSVRECVFVCVSVGWGDVVKEAHLNKQCITYIE